MKTYFKKVHPDPDASASESSLLTCRGHEGTDQGITGQSNLDFFGIIELDDGKTYRKT